MLYKVREFVNTRVLKSIFHTIFHSVNSWFYANTFSGQHKNSLNRLLLSQKKAQLLVLNVEMLNQIHFSITMKYLNCMTKLLLKIAFLWVYKSINFDL